MNFEVEFLAEVEESESLVKCVGKYTPATPDVYYLRNGDPGYPGDPPEVEVDAMWIDGERKSEKEIDRLLDDDQFRIMLEDKAAEQMSDKYGDINWTMEDK